MNTNEFTAIRTDWDIESSECPECGCKIIEHLVIQAYNRKFVESDIVLDEFDTEVDILQARCTGCEKLVYRSPGFAALLNETES